MIKKMVKKIFTYIIIAIALVAVYVFVEDIIKKNSSTPGDDDNKGTGSRKKYQTLKSDDNTVFSLREPMIYDERVRKIQGTYNIIVNKYYSNNFSEISVDGVFGKETESAVKNLLSKNSASWNEFKSLAKILQIPEETLNNL